MFLFLLIFTQLPVFLLSYLHLCFPSFIPLFFSVPYSLHLLFPPSVFFQCFFSSAFSPPPFSIVFSTSSSLLVPNLHHPQTLSHLASFPLHHVLHLVYSRLPTPYLTFSIIPFSFSIRLHLYLLFMFFIFSHFFFRSWHSPSPYSSFWLLFTHLFLFLLFLHHNSSILLPLQLFFPSFTFILSRLRHPSHSRSPCSFFSFSYVSPPFLHFTLVPIPPSLHT